MTEHSIDAQTTLYEGTFPHGDGAVKFVLSETPPDSQLVTAVIALLRYNQQFLLIEHKDRGLDFAGGHVEANESLDEAVRREVLEETGGIVRDARLFGYLQLAPALPIARSDREGDYYPFPHSYIPFYFCTLDSIQQDKVTDTDIVAMRSVNAAQAKTGLNKRDPHFGMVIDYVVDHLLDEES